ncbi:MAG: 2-C-methyl-D-erythritol 4-phosphate cytidylyltransferase [Dysgonamonadaceae bacterium]|jgi:2-C-methyl-D-erythritol 4-phosphate cytidylyltransferase|nr:2-C-methyl-D-erythritol 4-phosphate cytidylyltransferase [Dysgonamonadaceae bacterium]
MPAKEKIIIIVAGGKGERMGANMPKQFLPLNGKPILMHTIEAFYTNNPAIRIIVVLPEMQQAYWADLCIAHGFNIRHRVVSGGETRYHSVKNALALISPGSIVGIHDGVRPLIDQQVIRQCFQAAETHPAVIPVIPLSDSIREIGQTEQQSRPVDRQRYRLVQTPQVFQSDILLQAYEAPYNPQFTDDASVVGQISDIHLVAGNKENIKITTREDLIIAEALLAQPAKCRT